MHTDTLILAHILHRHQSIITSYSRVLFGDQPDRHSSDRQADGLTRFPCCWLHCRTIKIVSPALDALIIIDIIHSRPIVFDSPLLLRGLDLPLQGFGDLMEEVAPFINQSINIIKRHWE